MIAMAKDSNPTKEHNYKNYTIRYVCGPGTEEDGDQGQGRQIIAQAQHTQVEVVRSQIEVNQSQVEVDQPQVEVDQPKLKFTGPKLKLTDLKLKFQLK